MKILIDGDSCHVLKSTERIARKNGIDCHIYCDSRRSIESRYSKVHLTDTCRDAADFAILSACRENDIVVTSDGGLAAMALAKNAYVLNPYGGQYTNDNIMEVLAIRAMEKQKPGKPVKRHRHGASPLERKETYQSTLYRLVMECRK